MNFTTNILSQELKKELGEKQKLEAKNPREIYFFLLLNYC